MRGSHYPDLDPQVTKAILMTEYHQRYEDLDDMPLYDVLFFLRLHENKVLYQEQEMKKAQNKNKGIDNMRRSR